MPDAKQERDHVLGAGRMETQEVLRNWWVVNAEAESKRDDYLKPEYLSAYARKLRPLELVEIRKDDGTYWGLFLVLAVDRTYARLHPIIEHNLTTRDVSQTQAARYIYAWKGPTKKHCIIRTSDSAIVHEGGQTKEEAVQWLNENEKVLG